MYLTLGLHCHTLRDDNYITYPLSSKLQLLPALLPADDLALCITKKRVRWERSHLSTSVLSTYMYFSLTTFLFIILKWKKLCVVSLLFSHRLCVPLYVWPYLFLQPLPYFSIIPEKKSSANLNTSPAIYLVPSGFAFTISSWTFILTNTLYQLLSKLPKTIVHRNKCSSICYHLLFLAVLDIDDHSIHSSFHPSMLKLSFLDFCDIIFSWFSSYLTIHAGFLPIS